MHARSLSGRPARLGGIGLAVSIIALVLTLGDATPPRGADDPEVPIASGLSGQPPTVRELPPADADEPAPSTAQKGRSDKRRATSAVSPVKSPATEAPAETLRVWSAVGSYEKGELVTYDGSTYRARQDYTGVGDPSWINAESLWLRL